MLPVAPLLLALAGASVPPATVEPAVLVDIRSASASDVDRLKQRADWWLELGNTLLVAGQGQDRGEAAALPVLGRLDALAPEQLALRATGCAAADDAPGELLARGGRWELRRLGVGQALPQATTADEAWRRVAPDTVIARQYRLDAGVTAPPDPGIMPIVQHIDAARWFDDVSQLASWDRSSFGTTELFAARDWIGASLAGLGLTTRMEDFQMWGPSGRITRQNVIGQWTGTTHPDEWVIVGAHYDSRNANPSSITNTPGAEDNASGCAGVIELARALLPFRPERSVLFMCYAGEEQGLDGSQANVDALTASGDIAKVKAVVIMDMIGYSVDGDLSVDFESYPAWQNYLQRFGAAAATYVPGLDVLLSTSAWGSDHVPYLNAGRQTLLAIESDWDIYPHYHKSTDTPANMGPHAQAMGGAILKVNAAMLGELAGASDVILAAPFD
ncbi:M28 family metallopeptidase [Dokdonella sp.]|uniref:M28 family metallopeptidase n=1 Tax=Dokdonella sp. TaxID=2291710 RepID=UPI0031C5DBE0|nr:M28 family peptidase [Dokdonella sp.]